MRYRYSGPNSAATLKIPDGKGGFTDQDVLLWHGQEIDLPAEHDYVKVLVSKGHLTPVQATAITEPPAPAKTADLPVVAAPVSAEPPAPAKTGRAK
ncbi:MAG: hypothetical protein LBE85_11350 [Candidatus Accumulibacter sp.]|jgi:hypothetical protein|nr:hypothetical protein [Accumulibacter sp.]